MITEREKAVNDYISFIESQGGELNASDIKFTCDNCSEKETCEFAFDTYNMDGDCIAEK